jgi:type VI secretion system secreted protein Hcp
METRKTRIGLVAMMVMGGVLAYVFTAGGGSLEPSSPPQPTMRTLSELYDKVDSLGRGGMTYPEKPGFDQWSVSEAPIGPWIRLVIDGNEIEGESTVATLDRENKIECYGFDYGLDTPREESTGMLTGRRQHSPVSILKRVDKSSPLLYKALCENEPVNSVEIRFYRPVPGGQGQEEHYYTILLENGYVATIRSAYTNVEGFPLLEKVSFVFQDITWTYEIGGATHHDSWAGEA